MQQVSAFKVLGVDPRSSRREMVAAYRRLAMEFHPDKAGNDPSGAARFREVTEAYRRLSTEEGWSAEAALLEHPGGNADWTEDFRSYVREAGASGISDTQRPRSRRGKDVHLEVAITLEEAFEGGTLSIEQPEGTCSECSGRGRVSGGPQRPCEDCGGEGTLLRSRGMMRVRIACSGCEGRGSVSHLACPSCAHPAPSAKRAPPGKISVVIPRGCEDGHAWRLSGLGGRGTNGGSAGDLIVTARLKPHAVFTRSGAQLGRHLRLSAADAALGTDIVLSVLDGGSIPVRVPPGVQHGEEILIAGHGMPCGDQRGDLVLRVEVAVPRDISPALRQAYERLRQIERREEAAGCR